MSKSSRESSVLGNFHEPSTSTHPPSSIGNQQIWGPGGSQVGSIEYVPTKTGLDLNLYNTDGKKVSDL